MSDIRKAIAELRDKVSAMQECGYDMGNQYLVGLGVQAGESLTALESAVDGGTVDYTEEATRLSYSAMLQLPNELMIPELAKVFKRVVESSRPTPVLTGIEKAEEEIHKAYQQYQTEKATYHLGYGIPDVKRPDIAAIIRQFVKAEVK